MPPIGRCWQHRCFKGERATRTRPLILRPFPLALQSPHHHRLSGHPPIRRLFYLAGASPRPLQQLPRAGYQRCRPYFCRNMYLTAGLTSLSVNARIALLGVKTAGIGRGMAATIVVDPVLRGTKAARLTASSVRPISCCPVEPRSVGCWNERRIEARSLRLPIPMTLTSGSVIEPWKASGRPAGLLASATWSRLPNGCGNML